MPRVLIVGCGYVGGAAADLFHENGWQVEGWTAAAASAAKQLAKPYPVIPVDVSDRQQVNARSENFEVIIHCASTRGGGPDLYRKIYFDGVRNLFDRFVGATILMSSSTSVYAQDQGEWVTETEAADPQHETGRILREAEELALSRGGVVARLAAIHGPGRSALLKRFISDEAVIDPEDDRFTNHIHRDDIASALLMLADPQFVGIYNVADDKPIRRSECYQWLAKKLERPLPPLGKSTVGAKRGRSNKRVSNARLRGTGWAPRYPSFADAMEQSILPSFGL